VKSGVVARRQSAKSRGGPVFCGACAARRLWKLVVRDSGRHLAGLNQPRQVPGGSARLAPNSTRKAIPRFDKPGYGRCIDFEVRQTEIFARWLANLHDGRARGRINARILRLSIGNPGDTKSVGGGVSEMRIDYGPGYRVYFVRRGEALVILVAGGDKPTQNHDVAMASARPLGAQA
jgi:putative addiction module killer protein